MPNPNTDILLRLLLEDKFSQAWDVATARIQEGMKKATNVKDIESLERQWKDVAGAIEAAEKAAKRKAQEVEKASKQEITALKAEARVLSATASAIVSGLEKAQIGVIRNIAGQIEGISRTSLVAGTGIIGGIFAGAAKYVNDAKEATAVTVKWEAEQDSLNKSGERFGAVLAEQSLPLLERAADIAETASKFIAKNPELVQAALNTGVVLATMGAVGIAVTKGIKFIVDAKYLLTIPVQLQAAELQDRAADKQLQAALLKAKEKGVDIPGVAGGASLLSAGPLAAILAGAAGAAAIGRGAANFGAKQFGFQSPEDFWKKMLEKLGLVKSAADIAADSLGKTGIVLSAANSPQFDQILQSYEDYKADDLALVKQHYEERQGIVQDALNAELEENRQYAASVAKVNQQRSSALADAAKNFEQANIKAEADYQKNRAQIIRDGAVDIEKIQADLQERLRKLADDHAERSADLTAARDALGLAKENRSFQKSVSDERRQAGQEIRDRRQDIAQRLADLKQSYEQERAQRFAEYQARVAEIQAQAAERLKELAAEHQAELLKIREQKAAKLRELDAQFADERKRRYQQFLQQLRDLDASLLGETKLKQQYQAKELQDLDAFLAAYRSRLATIGGGTTTTTTTSGASGGSSAPPSSTFSGLFGFASGGYTPTRPSIIRVSEQGDEFIMRNQTTRAAERAIGGRLTQQAILGAMMRGKGSAITLNDHRRFDSSLSLADRRAIMNDTQQMLQELLQ